MLQQTAFLPPHRFPGIRFNSSKLDNLDDFIPRHIGPRQEEIPGMLDRVASLHLKQPQKFSSLQDLSDATVPESIQFKKPLEFFPAQGESATLQELKTIAQKNHNDFTSLIGMGYYGTKIPSVILRNVIENPGWYTPYTPYQAEISQGRLEGLLNYQTLITQLTGLDISNSSLLDEGTAAAEAMALCHSHAKRKKPVFFVSSAVHPQTVDVIRTRAKAIGVKTVVGDHNSFDFAANPVCGAIVQYPDTFGFVEDFKELSAKLHKTGALLVCATDLMALTHLSPPSTFDADIALGSTQRFGLPLGFGGPHCGFFSCKNSLQRLMPGRVIGISKDAQGFEAYRMSLQTREQHIRREKATSNICTAQALLANLSAFYAIYHGPEGLKNISNAIRRKTQIISKALEMAKAAPQVIKKGPVFDTLYIDTGSLLETTRIRNEALKRKINLRYYKSGNIGLSIDETTTTDNINSLIEIFTGKSVKDLGFDCESLNQKLAFEDYPTSLKRNGTFLQQKVFNRYHSESEMMRYLFKLQKKDLGLDTSIIPLGSCTLKLNAASEMIPITWPEFSDIHPFVPSNQSQGYLEMIKGLEKMLCNITGFKRISFQPNAGSQGEFAGLLAIKNYLESIGQGHRRVCLLPSSAHGTNPASAVMAGLDVVVVKCDVNGNIDMQDLRDKAEKHKDDLACVMVTYPSTHGIFEEDIRELVEIIHAHGGQVYMDGANMNAQCGLCSPADIGADVCHLNLHKTFAIPHGGGGPGVGPIGVAEHLVPFLPGHCVVVGATGDAGQGAIASAPFGSASILPISWVYLKMMGSEGLTKATQVAILNANYMVSRLKDDFKILYKGGRGFVGHEFIIDCRPFKHLGIESEDIAKRLMDFGIHAPTQSFPVGNTLMVEPTESESKAELDRLIDALLKIRQEIRDIESGKLDRKDNPLKNAPHSCQVCVSDDWKYSYPREMAAYPVDSVRASKFWPSVGRINNVYGDMNLMTTKNT